MPHRYIEALTVLCWKGHTASSLCWMVLTAFVYPETVSLLSREFLEF